MNWIDAIIGVEIGFILGVATCYIIVRVEFKKFIRSQTGKP